MTMTLIEYARKLRPLIEKAALSLSDEDAAEAPVLFPVWSEDGTYTAGDRLRYNGVLYKCLISHSAQSAWNPEDAQSLWAKVLIPTDEEGQQTEIPEWEQPGSTNPYMTGDKVRYGGVVYESLIDNNIWSPIAYPQGWRAVQE